MTRSPEIDVRRRADQRQGHEGNPTNRSVAYRDIALLLELLDAERAQRAALEVRLSVSRSAYDKLWADYQLIAEPALPFS